MKNRPVCSVSVSVSIALPFLATTRTGMQQVSGDTKKNACSKISVIMGGSTICPIASHFDHREDLVIMYRMVWYGTTLSLGLIVIIPGEEKRRDGWGIRSTVHTFYTFCFCTEFRRINKYFQIFRQGKNQGRELRRFRGFRRGAFFFCSRKGGLLNKKKGLSALVVATATPPSFNLQQ